MCFPILDMSDNPILPQESGRSATASREMTPVQTGRDRDPDRLPGQGHGPDRDPNPGRGQDPGKDQGRDTDQSRGKGQGLVTGQIRAQNPQCTQSRLVLLSFVVMTVFVMLCINPCYFSNNLMVWKNYEFIYSCLQKEKAKNINHIHTLVVNPYLL